MNLWCMPTGLLLNSETNEHSFMKSALAEKDELERAGGS